MPHKMAPQPARDPLADGPPSSHGRRCPTTASSPAVAGGVRGLLAWQARLSGFSAATIQVAVTRLTRRCSSKALTMQERPDTGSNGFECSIRFLLGGRGNPAAGHKGRPYNPPRLVARMTGVVLKVSGKM